MYQVQIFKQIHQLQKIFTTNSGNEILQETQQWDFAMNA